MTTNHQTTDSLTSLTVPAARCDACGAVPALDLPGGYLECPRCHARRVMLQGAQAHLAAELAPLLGIWAQHWQAAGLTERQLTDVLELMSLTDLAAQPEAATAAEGGEGSE